MHRALKISEANATQHISNSSGISRELLACRFQKTGPVRSIYPNRAVTLIEQSLQHKIVAKFASPIQNFWLRH